MSTSRYTANIDVRNPNDSHAMAVAAVPARSSVLDIGTADGSVARLLVELQCKVTGIEMDEAAAAVAREVCHRVIVADIERIDLASEVSDRFDVVLMLDVLEHLRDPERVLSSVRDVLRPAGWVVISIPNVAHAAVRLQLLEGRFNYTELGLLDKTHLRFYDRNSAERLVTDAGYEILEFGRVTRSITNTEIPVDTRHMSDEIQGLLASDPEAETYQFVMIAAPHGSPLIDHPPLLPAWTLQQRVRQLEDVEQSAGRHIRMLETRLGEVENELRGLTEGFPSDPEGRTAWVLQVLDQLREQSQERRIILRRLLSDLQLSSQQLTLELQSMSELS